MQASDFTEKRAGQLVKSLAGPWAFKPDPLPPKTVSFSPEPGRMIIGRIIRANAKTVTVLASSGARWRVSPEFLARTTDAEAVESSGVSIVELPVSFRRS